MQKVGYAAGVGAGLGLLEGRVQLGRILSAWGSVERRGRAGAEQSVKASL